MAKFDTYIEPLRLTTRKNPRDVFGFGFNKAIAVSGLQALINKWAKAFLTEKGSDPTDPEYGGYFATLIGGNITSEEDLRDIVQLTADEASSDLRRYQRANPPATQEDAFESAEVYSIRIINLTHVEIVVYITNKAGQTALLNVPVSLSVSPNP